MALSTSSLIKNGKHNHCTINFAYYIMCIMNTEDDTFRKLKQIPFLELRAIINNMDISEFYSQGAVDAVLAEHNWTWKEYRMAMYEYRR